MSGSSADEQQGAAPAEEEVKADPEGGAPETPEAKAPEQVENAAEATAAEGEKDKGPQSMMEAVEAALKPAEDPEKSPGSEGEQAEAANAAEEGEAKAEKPDADLTEAEQAEQDKLLPFHKHPRWQQVLKQRDDAVAKIEAKDAEIETYKASHETVQGMQSYMEANGLDENEVNDGLNIMSMMKAGGTPEGADKALRALAPYVQQLQFIAGYAYPEDIQADVEAGALSEERAKELTQSRYAASQAAADQARKVADEGVDPAPTPAPAQQPEPDLTKVRTDAMNDWQARWAQSDPDYDKKTDLVRDQLKLRLMEADAEGKLPSTAQEVAAFADKALAEVDARLTAMVPKPKPMTPKDGGSSKSGTRPEINSMRDAIDAGLAMTR